MGRPVPLSAISDSTTVPTGKYLVSIESFEPTVTRTSDRPERLMYKQQLRIIEPRSHANLVLFDSQTIGNDDDPDAELPETWVKARRLKQICAAAGLEADLDEDEMIQSIMGQQVMVYVQEYEDDGSYDEKYKGQPRNRIQRYYKVGEIEPGLEQSAASKQPPRRPQRTAPTPPGAQAQPARPTPARPAPAQAAQPAQRRAPLQRPGAAKPAPAAAKPNPKPAAKPATVQEVVCSICGEDENGNPYTVPEDQYEGHVAEHEQNGDI